MPGQIGDRLREYYSDVLESESFLGAAEAERRISGAVRVDPIVRVPRRYTLSLTFDSSEADDPIPFTPPALKGATGSRPGRASSRGCSRSCRRVSAMGAMRPPWLDQSVKGRVGRVLEEV